MQTMRLLIDPPLPGPINMARDEAILAACSPVDPRPTLRFYAWSPATISLGYFQPYEDYQALSPPAGDLPVVRRTTGGGAILHDLELTYSLAMPIDHPLIAGRPNRLYELAHQAIAAAIGHGARMLGGPPEACGAAARRGPFFCFKRRHGLDVVADDPTGPGGASKIAGSAQRRTKQAVLQHGSIILDNRYAQQPAATWSALAGPIEFAEAADRLAPAFETVFDMKLDPSEWRHEEIAAAEAIEAKYAGEAWTKKRLRAD